MPQKMRGFPNDQSITRTEYNTDAIRKFKRMSAGAALVMLLLLLRGDRGGRGASVVAAVVAIGVEAPDSPAGAKYTRAAVKYTALILAVKLAALAAFALKVGPEL